MVIWLMVHALLYGLNGVWFVSCLNNVVQGKAYVLSKALMQHASCSIEQTRNAVLCLELKEHARAKQQCINDWPWPEAFYTAAHSLLAVVHIYRPELAAATPLTSGGQELLVSAPFSQQHNPLLSRMLKTSCWMPIFCAGPAKFGWLQVLLPVFVELPVSAVRKQAHQYSTLYNWGEARQSYSVRPKVSCLCVSAAKVVWKQCQSLIVRDLKFIGRLCDLLSGLMH